ncbi:MAG: hypothetical protein NTW69_06245 [Chloroflexi bacterium]|nr:hypothetical protein [Chloroflexota bacterium]
MSNRGTFGTSSPQKDIPAWVLNHPDNPPTKPSAWDDEFDGKRLHSKWTKVGSGTLIWTVSNSLLRLEQAAVNERGKGIEQPCPTGNWKIRTKCFFNGPALNYNGIGLLVKNAVNGRYDLYTMMHHSTWGYFAPLIIHTTAIDTYSSETNANQWYMNMQWYLELEYDGTNFNFRHSADGVNYYTIYTYAQASFLAGVPTHFGVCTHHYGLPMDVSWEYFRRVA